MRRRQFLAQPGLLLRYASRGAEEAPTDGHACNRFPAQDCPGSPEEEEEQEEEQEEHEEEEEVVEEEEEAGEEGSAMISDSSGASAFCPQFKAAGKARTNCTHPRTSRQSIYCH